MIRNFTDHTKEECQRLISNINKNENIQDRIVRIEHQYPKIVDKLELCSQLDSIYTYQKSIIEINENTLYQIEKIFHSVEDIETHYHMVLQNIMQTCREFNRVLLLLNDVIIPKGNLMTMESIHLVLKEAFIEYNRLFVTYIDWEKQLEALLETYKSKECITDSDKDVYIELYERYHADFKKQLDMLIKLLSEEHVKEIKYILYTSKEPYRSIYLNELDSYTIGNISGDDTGYFTRRNNTINVDMTVEEHNPRGPYTTFFHESGHAIDYNYNDDGCFYSITYRDSVGKSMQESIYQDVRNDVSEIIARYTTDKESQNRILDYIMGAGKIDIATLNKTEEKLLENIQDYYAKEMYGPSNEACSDVYGGVTNNIIHGSYGHWSESYWYHSDGSATYAQSKELWAEYYSYRITNNEEALQNLKEHFPNTSKFLDQMAISMVS